MSDERGATQPTSVPDQRSNIRRKFYNAVAVHGWRRRKGVGDIATLAAPPVLPRVGADTTDDALVAAARRGDDLAFEQLYHRYQRRIAAYVHGMVKDHGRAEDITQEVFMSALRRMRETERPIVFKPWIYEIAKNACIDAFRRSRRTEEVSYDADDGLGAADHLKLVSSTPEPDAAADTRKALEDLRGAFGGLSESHHDILVMRELEGLSYREIGERLGMSRPSVESTLFRARRRLSEEYEELASGKRCSRFQELIAQAADVHVRLGARDERKMSRHVSHCQACRRVAGLAGIDVAALAAGRGLREKIAALLPLPAFLKRRWFGGDGSLANLSASAGQYAEPMAGWVKAAAVAATVALAGAGAGAVTSQGDSTPSGPEPASSATSERGSAAAKAGARDRGAAPSGFTSTATGRTGARPAQGAGTSSGSGAAGSTSNPSSGPSAGTPDAADGARKTVGGTGDAAAGAVKKTTGAVTKTVGGVTKTVNGVTQTTGAVVNGTTGAVKKTVDRTTGAVTNTVKKTTGAATGTVNKTTGTATGAVDNTVKKTTGAVNKTTGAVTGAVDKATNGATSGVSSTVNKTAGAATGAVDKTTTTVTGAANKATGAATGTVDKTVGSTAGAVNTTATTATGAVKDTVGTATGVAGGLLGGK